MHRLQINNSLYSIMKVYESPQISTAASQHLRMKHNPHLQ